MNAIDIHTMVQTTGNDKYFPLIFSRTVGKARKSYKR